MFVNTRPPILFLVLEDKRFDSNASTRMNRDQHLISDSQLRWTAPKIQSARQGRDRCTSQKMHQPHRTLSAINPGDSAKTRSPECALSTHPATSQKVALELRH